MNGGTGLVKEGGVGQDLLGVSPEEIAVSDKVTLVHVLVHVFMCIHGLSGYHFLAIATCDASDKGYNECMDIMEIHY